MIRGLQEDLVTSSAQNRASRKKRPEQQWKTFDKQAQKTGMCGSVFWVKPVPENNMQLLNKGKKEKKYTQGNVYRGEWKDNRKHGFGTQIWANGNKYEGDWFVDKQHGHGTFWIATGKKPNQKLRKVYTGRWCNGTNEGLGVYYYKSGDRYEGNWVQGMRQGQGTHFFANGDVYVGEWNENKQSGFGTLTKENGDVYEGEWLNGKREGAGIYYYKTKEKIYDGEWVNDIPKCGVYCAASEFFEDDETENDGLLSMKSKPMKKRQRPIPRLRLLDPNSILTEEIAKIQKSRQAVRNMPFIQLEKLFSEEGLDDLRGIFGMHDPNLTGYIPALELENCMLELKFQLTPAEFAQLLLDLDKRADETINFSEFVKAAHLVDNMKTNSLTQFTQGVHNMLESDEDDEFQDEEY